MPGSSSETIRFSVETLLYYAPRIATVGTTLAQAEATAQGSLLGLGNFCGSSWPDHPFAASYPPSQDALLIMVKELAAQIQGIAVGIQTMARNYWINEASLAAAADQIAAREAGPARLLAHDPDQPSPPDDPASLPGPGATPLLAPDPQAGPTPAPLSTRTPSSAPPPAPAASPTPSPEAQPPPTAHPQAWQHSGGLSLDGPWPSGDPARMDQAAAYWNNLTLALENAWSDLQRYTALIMSGAEGPAATAFSDYVDKLTGSGGSLPRAIAASQELNNVCLNQAERIRALKASIENLLIQLAATFVIGQVISLLTFETTQALADALDGRILFYLTEVVEVFYADSETVSVTLTDALEAVAKVLSRGIAAGAQGMFIGGTDQLLINALDQAFGRNPVAGTAALRSMLLGGLLGGVGGTVTTSAGLMSTALISMGEGDSAAAPLLLALGRQLKSGSITVAAAAVALEELIRQGKLTPEQYLAAVAGARLGTAVAPNTGSHAAP